MTQPTYSSTGRFLRRSHLWSFAVLLSAAGGIVAFVMSRSLSLPAVIGEEEQNRVVAHTGPAITVLESETNIPVHWSFSLSNMTHTETVLRYVSASCSCLEVANQGTGGRLIQNSLLSIPAGQVATFDVSARVGSSRGVQIHGIEFADTGLDGVSYQAVQSVAVLPDIQSSPKCLSVIGSQSLGSELVEREVTFLHRARTLVSLDRSLRLTSTGDREAIRSLRPESDPKPEGGFWVRSWTAVVQLRPLPPNAERDYYSRIDVSIDGDPSVTATLPVTIVIPAGLRVFPGRSVEFIPESNGKALTRKVLITSSDGRPFAVRSLCVKNPVFTAVCELNVEKPSHVVELLYHSASLDEETSTITVETSCMAEPKLVLDLRVCPP